MCAREPFGVPKAPLNFLSLTGGAHYGPQAQAGEVSGEVQSVSEREEAQQDTVKHQQRPNRTEPQSNSRSYIIMMVMMLAMMTANTYRLSNIGLFYSC